MRGALAEAYAARGHHQSDLIFAYSPRMDADVILRSSLEYAHFLLAESDPFIAQIDYAPMVKVARLAGERVAALVDAEVVDLDGSITWREVKYLKSLESGQDARSELQIRIQRELAAGWTANHEIYTEREIYKNPTKIRNWNRVISWIAQAREFPLVKESRDVFFFIQKKGSVKFSDVLRLGDSETAALFAAALFKLIQKGKLYGDLDQVPLSPHSRFSKSGAEL